MNNDSALTLPADDDEAVRKALIAEYKALSDEEAIARLRDSDPLKYDRESGGRRSKPSLRSAIRVGDRLVMPRPPWLASSLPSSCLV